MIVKILQSKHWQIFVLAYGLYLISTVPFLVFSSEIFLGFMLYTFLLVICIPLIWYYAIGVGLQKNISEHLRRPTGFFKFALFVLVTCLATLFALPTMWYVMVLLAATTQGGLVIITSLILLITFCLVYAMYYTARTLKTAELQRPTTFSDFSTDFFLLYFLPIGIWFLQPRINDLARPTSTIPDEEQFV